jgi:hypothetical protein
VVVTQQQVNAYYEAHKDQFRVPARAEAGKPEPPPTFKPLAEVAPQIESELRQEEATRAVDEDMKEVNDEIATETEVPFGSEEVRTADFAAIAAKFKLVHQVTPLFPADKASFILPGASDLATKAFGQSVSNIRRPSVTLAATEGKFVFQILKIQDPRPALYEAIKPQVEKDYRLAEGYKMAEQLADEALKANPTSLDAAAEKIEAAIAERLKTVPLALDEVQKSPKDFVQLGRSDFFGRPKEYMGFKFPVRTGLPGNFSYGNFVDEAFALNDNVVGKAAEPGDARAVFLLKRAAVKPADPAEFDKDRARITDDLLNRKREAARQTWLAEVRRRAKPSPEVMKYLTALM